MDDVKRIVLDPRLVGQVTFTTVLSVTLSIAAREFPPIARIALAVAGSCFFATLMFGIACVTFPRSPVSREEALRVRTLLFSMSGLWLIGFSYIALLR
jgi:hypothetical protein